MTPLEFLQAHVIILAPALAFAAVFAVAGLAERVWDRRQR